MTIVKFPAVGFVHALKLLSERVKIHRRAVQLCPSLIPAHMSAKQRKDECRDGHYHNCIRMVEPHLTTKLRLKTLSCLKREVNTKVMFAEKGEE